MTRRLHTCLTCTPEDSKRTIGRKRRGLTRHRTRVCALCRMEGVTVANGEIKVPIVIDWRGRGA